MNELISYVNMDTSSSLPLLVPYEAGIWHCVINFSKMIDDAFDFMERTYNEEPININNVIIDNMELKEYFKLDDLYDLHWNKAGWYNGGSIIYIRFYEWRPAIVFQSFKYGRLFGFTNGSPKLVDGMMYRPGLLTSPVVEQSADAFTYDKMKFNSVSVAIDNTNGQFDDVNDLFGNEFNLLVDERKETNRKNENNIVQLFSSDRMDYDIVLNSETKRMIILPIPDSNELPKGFAQYYIANIVAGLEKVTFTLKDKRERISANIPNAKFTVDKYPKIEDNLIDNDMQEAYGYCLGVPGVCTQGKQIFVSGNAPPYLDQYHYRFSSQICRVDRIQVKMTSGELPVDPVNDPNGKTRNVDGWTTVYQLKKPNDGSSDDWAGTWPASGMWKPGIIAGNIVSYLDNGEIALDYAVAKQGGERENGMNEVRMDGIFNIPYNKNNTPYADQLITPLDIIKDIMEKYVNTPYDDTNFRTIEIEHELKQLNHKIGILYDKQQTIFEAIEKLQSGCVLGFQFVIYQNKYTARLDNPNRDLVDGLSVIQSLDIVNLDEIEIDWNADLYGTQTDIEYAHNYNEETGRHWIGDGKRQAILDIHRIEKVWSVTTLLRNPDDAKLKSNIMLDDFIKLRPIIKNIKLFGIKWFDLRVYDIVFIDLTLKEKLRNRLIDRSFGGRETRGQILRVECDTSTGETTIDVRVREESEAWLEA